MPVISPKPSGDRHKKSHRHNGEIVPVDYF